MNEIRSVHSPDRAWSPDWTESGQKLVIFALFLNFFIIIIIMFVKYVYIIQIFFISYPGADPGFHGIGGGGGGGGNPLPFC